MVAPAGVPDGKLARYWLLKDTGERTRTGRAFTNRINGYLVVIP